MSLQDKGELSFQDKLVYAFDLLNKLQDEYHAEDVGGNVAQKLQFCQDEATLESVTDYLQAKLLDAMRNAAEDAADDSATRMMQATERRMSEVAR